MTGELDTRKEFGSPRHEPITKRSVKKRDYARHVAYAVCCLAGSASLLNDARSTLQAKGVTQALSKRASAPLFNWLVEALSYQGIADRVAADYIRQHGRITWQQIAHHLKQPPPCPKLKTYWTFSGCGYNKTSHSCNEPEHIAACPLPRHDLRNGHLNQMAYSLFLFVRDLANADLGSWIDSSLAAADRISSTNRLANLREALLGPLRQVYGVSDKVLAMSLSSLLLSAKDRPLWHEVGASLIAVDTLVHNFLHRTGILARCNAQHPYGAACYAPSGCAEIIENLSQQIDARVFNSEFPAVFPRFLQHAIWHYCAADGRNICNGNRIDDDQRCNNTHCQLFARCDCIALRPPRAFR
jgi:hypothetical protein